MALAGSSAGRPWRGGDARDRRDVPCVRAGPAPVVRFVSARFRQHRGGVRPPEDRAPGAPGRRSSCRHRFRASSGPSSTMVSMASSRARSWLATIAVPRQPASALRMASRPSASRLLVGSSSNRISDSAKKSADSCTQVVSPPLRSASRRCGSRPVRPTQGQVLVHSRLDRPVGKRQIIRAGSIGLDALQPFEIAVMPNNPATVSAAPTGG